MARFTSKDLYLKDDDQIYFGNNHEAAMWYEGSELMLNHTISGVDPEAPGHLVTRRYLDTFINTSVSGGFRTVDYIAFDRFAETPPHEQGLLFWDEENHTLAFYNNENDITVQIGQEFIVPVRNETGSDIPAGTPVRVSGSSSESRIPLISLSYAATRPTSPILGLATHNILDGHFGYVTAFGIVDNINTTGLIEGQPVFVSDVTPGGYIQPNPDAPSYTTRIGNVVYSHASEGRIFVNPFRSPALEDLSNVDGTTAQDNYTLRYVVTSGIGVWDPQPFDHGYLDGLIDDDHPQYVPTDGSRGFTSTVSGIDPVYVYDLATKNYVDTEISNITLSGITSNLDGGRADTIYGGTSSIDGGNAFTVY